MPAPVTAPPLGGAAPRTAAEHVAHGLALAALLGGRVPRGPYLYDQPAAARFHCLGDGGPGGELQACQTLAKEQPL